MSTITILLAPVGPLAGVRDALTDWSAAGLIDPFLWVEPPMIGRSSISALAVRDGVLEGTTLNALAGAGRTERIRVVSLVPALTGVGVAGSAVEQELAQFLESSFGQAEVLRVRAIVARAGDTATLADLAVDGWHNVLLSPEDSSGPAMGQTRLAATTDPFELGIPAAAALAGLVGLWTGVEGSPLDDENLTYGRQARLSRSYYRRLGTAELEGALRRDVLSMDRGLPLPTQFGASASYVDDAALATQTMAGQLWARHPGVLRGPRDPAPTSKATAIGAWQALKMFFGFLLAALRNAPRAWLARVVNRMRADAAAAVHGLVFGSAPSAYAVVVKGVTADGMPASWLDYGAAAAAIDKILDEQGGAPRDHEAHADLSSLWQDYAAASLTLADGGERITGLTPVQIGAQRGVLRRPGSIVPGVDRAFDGVPPHLAATVGLPPIEPFDVLGAHTLEQRLRILAEQPTVGVAAATALQAFASWKSEHGDSFAARVGTRIGESIVAVTGEIRELLEDIRRAASADDILTASQAQQKRLARTVRTVLIVFAALLVITGVLLATGVVGLAIGLSVLGVLVLTGFATTLIVFLRGQRELFRLVNARNELLAREELARRNLRHAVRDARRLTDAYGQFVAWSRVVGTVLGAPFGRVEETALAPDVDVADLPQSVRLGSGVVDPAAVGSAAIELRRDIFAIGWLDQCWTSALAGAPRQIGPRGVEIEANPRALYRQAGSGEDSLLPIWTDALLAQGVDAAVGDATWSRVLEDLDGPRAPIADRLLTSVADARLAGGAPVPYAVFLAGTDDPSRLHGDRLDDALLTDSARASGASVVERPDSRVGRRGLSRIVVLTELTASIPAYEFLLHREPVGGGGRDGGLQDDPPWAAAPVRATAPEPVSAEPAALEVPDLFDGMPF
ncbi:DUF4231 domain-containing protein [Rathayibacter sp. VKM Ac-2760]|uniref:DUF4231 domain-containing protein n=1 Tax=Rathayibacter sp. VKM Ac-2760 TaxID=2609253 RepID=UPI001318A11D|nr:DUF4231 domain-containing protein [Rathayibacter sp. VKM Ac-2760]QHC57197.1 hypothetical protein GSU72_00345 [Rathayibacter sp. VKM Ac-2760]